MGEALPQIGSGGDGRKHPGQIGAQLAQELDLEELQPAPLMSTANAVRSQAAKVNRPRPLRHGVRCILAAVLATGLSAQSALCRFGFVTNTTLRDEGAREGGVEKID